MAWCSRVSVPIWGCLLLAAACSEPSPETGDAGPSCPAGTRAFQTACIPIFDSCKPDEVPLPGGGCKRVGIQECNTGVQGQVGLRGPPDWKCKPIGPPATCVPGWRRVSDGWCEPVLPRGKCPDGTMEVLGKATCQPIGDCGSGTWGSIKTTAATIFVDGAYTGGSSDGCRSRPFTSIGAALAKAKKDSHLALAAGTYNEDVSVETEGLTLEGRCALLVTIRGQSTGVKSRALEVKALGVTLRGVTVSGPRYGAAFWHDAGKGLVEQVVIKNCGIGGLHLYASGTVRDTLIKDIQRTDTGTCTGSSGVAVYGARFGTPMSETTLQRVVVRDSGPPKCTISFFYGVWVGWGARVLVSDSLVTANAGAAVAVANGELTLVRSMVSATRDMPPNPYIAGSGVVIGRNYYGTRPKATLRDSLVKDNDLGGVVVLSGTLLVERSVIADSHYSTTKKYSYGGVYVSPSSTYAAVEIPGLTIRDSLIAGNQWRGVALYGSAGVIERSIVRDTKRPPSWWKGTATGRGLAAYRHPVSGRGSTLTVRDSLVAGNADYGAYLTDSKATFERVVVRDNGRSGIFSHRRTTSGLGFLKLSDSLISGNRNWNLYFFADSTLDRTVVQGSARTNTDSNDYGAVISPTPSNLTPLVVTINESVFANNEKAGLMIGGARVSISRSVVRDTRMSVRSSPRYPGGEGGFGIVATLYPYTSLSLQPSTLTLTDSLISGNLSQGVLVEGTGTRADVRRCAIINTDKNLQGYGDGLAVRNAANLTVHDSLVDRSARAGLLYESGSGKLSRSVVRAGVFSVAIGSGASPTIDPDNFFVGNKENEVIRNSGLRAAQPPPMPPPSSLPDN